MSTLKKKIGWAIVVGPILSILVAACIVEPWLAGAVTLWFFMMFGLYLAGELEE